MINEQAYNKSFLQNCDLVNNTRAACTTPSMNNYWNTLSPHKYPETVSLFFMAKLKIQLDGFEHEMMNFKITRDPTFKDWDEVKKYDPTKSIYHVGVSEFSKINTVKPIICDTSKNSLSIKTYHLRHIQKFSQYQTKWVFIKSFNHTYMVSFSFHFEIFYHVW